MFFLVLAALGGGWYWLLQSRKAAASQGSVAAQVAVLTEELRHLRESQWQIRTVVDRLREEHDFVNQLAAPPQQQD